MRLRQFTVFQPVVGAVCIDQSHSIRTNYQSVVKYDVCLNMLMLSLLTVPLISPNFPPPFPFSDTPEPDVAQSKAVSPAPRTMTVPKISGSWLLQAHIPGLLALAT